MPRLSEQKIGTFPITITLTPVTGLGDYAKPTYGTATTCRARKESAKRLTLAGADALKRADSMTFNFLPGFTDGTILTTTMESASIGLGSLITSGTDKYKIEAVDIRRDEYTDSPIEIIAYCQYAGVAS